MTLTARRLAEGAGWRVTDVICTAGPHDRAYEERHDQVCVAAVTAGHFQYRSQAGSALLAPAALLLGDSGHCFQCGHDHGTGDRCLSFQFAPDYWENLVASVPGARRAAITRAALPPLDRLIPVIAAAEAARDADADDPGRFEELALILAGQVASLLADGDPAPPLRSADERRIARALRRIEMAFDQPLSLTELAADAAMSPYHFLRTFRRVVGMTPYRYLLATRLRHAVTRLRRTDEPVSTIAFESGFNDLSTFNRRIRDLTGRAPGALRGNAIRDKCSHSV